MAPIEQDSAVIMSWLMTPGAPEMATLEGIIARARAPWRKQAACRDEDVSTFFPERGQSTAPAMAVCVGCPVRIECRDEALNDPELVGVWGGTSGRERRNARSKRWTAA